MRFGCLTSTLDIHGEPIKAVRFLKAGLPKVWFQVC